jgi:UrcA family protein
MIKSTILAVTLVLGAGAVAKPIGPALGPPTERVMYDDLNMSSTSAQAVLAKRIRTAANRVCEFGGMQTMEEFALSTNCYTRAVKDGLQQEDRLIAARASGGAALAASALIITAR